MVLTSPGASSAAMARPPPLRMRGSSPSWPVRRSSASCVGARRGGRWAALDQASVGVTTSATTSPQPQRCRQPAMGRIVGAAHTRDTQASPAGKTETHWGPAKSEEKFAESSLKHFKRTFSVILISGVRRGGADWGEIIGFFKAHDDLGVNQRPLPSPLSR